MSFGISSQTFEPRNRILSVPLETVLTERIWKHDLCRSSYETSFLIRKISFAISGFSSLRTLNILIPSFWIFWWWTETDSSWSSNSIKARFLIAINDSRHLSCNRLVLWFLQQLQQIKIKGQQLNCDLKNAFTRSFLLDYPRGGIQLTCCFFANIFYVIAEFYFEIESNLYINVSNFEKVLV